MNSMEKIKIYFMGIISSLVMMFMPFLLRQGIGFTSIYELSDKIIPSIVGDKILFPITRWTSVIGNCFLVLFLVLFLWEVFKTCFKRKR